jgi:hypothetical protein
MKRQEFLKRVAVMCGPVEANAARTVAQLPPAQRRSAARKLGQAAGDQGLTDFLISLIEDELIDDLASMLPGGSYQEAEEALNRLWARLLLMISPEAKNVLYAHHQLRLMLEQRPARELDSQGGRADAAFGSALDNARAVLSATEGAERHPVASKAAQPKETDR